jgi:rfaE bifunctional protein nucleotidyltransferase chain/domain
VGLNSDKSVERLKGKGRPINKAADRAYVLSGIYLVDYICIFEEDTPRNIIQLTQPDVLIKGGDWRLNEIVGKDIVEQRGGKVLSCEYLPNHSTTELIRKINSLSRPVKDNS